MVVLKIFNAEKKEDALCTLSLGSHILGRGHLLNCNDQRVSRRHANLTIEEDRVSLTSTHINPCFVVEAGSKTVTTLTKDSKKELKNGDKFALLPNKFWYSVKVCDDETVSTVEQNQTDISHDKLTQQVNDTAQCDASNVLNSTTNSKNGARTDAADPLQENKKLNEGLQVVSGVAGTSKRKYDDDENEGTATKQPKLTINADELMTKKVENCSKDSSDDIQLLISGSDDENITGHAEQNEIKLNLEDAGENNSVITVEINNQNYPSNSHNEGEEVHKNKEEEVHKKEEEPVHDNEGKQVTENEEKLEEPENTKEVESDENKNVRSGDGDHENSDAKNKTEASDEGAGPSTKREKCWYGSSCYRKQPSHRTDFSHPGDDDYLSDSNDNQPPCPYGVACYRRNILHRQHYKHLGPPCPKPGKDKPRKRKATKNVKYADSPLDDYDYDDPFLNDGSSDDFDTDSDFTLSESESEEESQYIEESEDIKRLLKEAKKFNKK